MEYLGPLPYMVQFGWRLFCAEYNDNNHFVVHFYKPHGGTIQDEEIRILRQKCPRVPCIPKTPAKVVPLKKAKVTFITKLTDLIKRIWMIFFGCFYKQKVRKP